jgi:hypothetical protein
MHAHRARIAEDIIAEFYVPSRRANRTVILCDGLPSVPCRGRLLDFFAKQGIWGIHIRYRGTWESDGNFLRQSPHLDVLDTVTAIEQGLKIICSDQVVHPPTEQIFVAGSSFGGAAALLASADERVTGAFAISPVIDWLELGESEPAELLYKLVIEGFGQAYRCSHVDFNKLLTGKFYNPIYSAPELEGSKIGIVHCVDDSVTPLSATHRFAEQTGCRLTEYKRGGHLSLNKIMVPRIWRKFKKFAKSF